MNIYTMKVFNLYIIILFVTSCNPFDDFKPDSETIVKKSWAKRAKQSSPDPLYCYSSLGDYACYKQPQKDQQEILKGGTFEEEKHAQGDKKTWWNTHKESWNDQKDNNKELLYS